MDELESFYANLYDSSSCSLDSATPMFLNVSRGFPASWEPSPKIKPLEMTVWQFDCSGC